ncbi:MAG: hypothetical protein M3N29_07910 [Chloroflexota bacterium]|nr:hypothetical protein [Chloroflexota bacterium]
MEMRNNPVAERGLQLEHKHGLDEWSPMLPERTAQTVVIGEVPADEVYRCQRVGCNEVVRTRPEAGRG